MNINTFKKLLAVQTTKYFAWQDDSDPNEPLARLVTGLRIGKLDDDVSLCAIYVENGLTSVEFVMDSLEPSQENLLLVNNFNANVLGLRASIQLKGRKNYLVIDQSTGYPLDEQGAVDFIIGTLNNINDERTLKYLEPLAVITK